MRRDSPWLALILLTAINTVGFIDRIVMNVLAVPIQIEFELTDTQVGLLTGLAFAVLNVMLGIVVARYAERGRRLTLIAVGTLLWSLATAACGMVTTWVQLLLARIGVGVGEAVGLPATQSVISDYFPPERRATALSVLLLAPPIGAFLGSAGGSWIGQEYGWSGNSTSRSLRRACSPGCWRACRAPFQSSRVGGSPTGSGRAIRPPMRASRASACSSRRRSTSSRSRRTS